MENKWIEIVFFHTTENGVRTKEISSAPWLTLENLIAIRSAMSIPDDLEFDNGIDALDVAIEEVFLDKDNV